MEIVFIFLTKDSCLKNFSIKFKLLSLSLFLVSISIVGGIVSYWSAGKIADNYSEIAEISYPNTAMILQMSGLNKASRIEILHLTSTNSSAEMKKNAVEDIEKNIKADIQLDKEYQEIPDLPGETPLYVAFRKGIDEQLIPLYKKVLELHKKNTPESITELQDVVYNQIPPVAMKNRADLAVLQEFHFKNAKISAARARETAEFSNWLILGLVSILGTIGLVTAYMFSSSLSRTLQEISVALDESSTHVSSAASQIASSSEELSQSTTEQAASLEETSASVEEMSSMVNINFENSKKAAESSVTSKKQAEKGRMVVEEMVQSMSKIDISNNNIMEQINLSNQQMAEIVKVIQEIETKTKVINDIVFQTKLLSFNASVEAARAGEQGKGFAVVAEEVGNLAQMSGNAAKEISDMLAASVSKVEMIAHETKTKVDVLIADGRDKIKAGTKIAEECGEVLAEIVENVTSVSTMAGEITNASDEQAKGIQEITKAMGQLDQVTQTNAATSEETASAAEELSTQAASLKNQVSNLVAVISGKGHRPTAVINNKAKPSAPAKQDHTSNVLPLKKTVKEPVVAKEAATRSTFTEFKKAAGGGGGRDSVPSYDHPGFEDV